MSVRGLSVIPVDFYDLRTTDLHGLIPATKFFNGVLLPDNFRVVEVVEWDSLQHLAHVGQSPKSSRL